MIFLAALSPPRSTLAIFLLIAGLSSQSSAETTLGLGVWANYRYLPDNEANQNAWGEIRDEALILYADGEAEEDEGRWRYSAELRIGPGSFTDPENNSTGGQFAMHKAWVGWQLDEDHQLIVGKSQVPFGWKTINFWPGDILLAGYGDQMDVGVKLTGKRGLVDYDLAFFLADDWGATSTDTLDDNAHWGSSTTYRKVRTWVGDVSYALSDNHALGLSLQEGKLQDLTGTPERPVDGSHSAAVLYYQGVVGDFFSKASYITAKRDLPAGYHNQIQSSARIENRRLALELGVNKGSWTFYLDASAARPQTSGNEAGTVRAFAPGIRHDYGPGWVYLEHLSQNGFIDRDGRIREGDFDAIYLTVDFYL